MSGLAKDRWKVVSPYLDRAMDMDEAQRRAWLNALRLDDAALARDLASLLEEQAAVLEEGFLEHAPPLPEPSSLAGYVVGSYRLAAPIGQGGMGSVWLAERCDGRFETRVAIKLLNLSLLGQRSARAEERFRREGRLLGRLTHANIARLIDAGVTTGGQPYLVLEYVDGQPIDRYCDERALGVEARVALFLDVLEAVSHAHTNLVVHRDIKPSNVLVSAAGQVKLLDFGIAKLLEDEASDGELSLLTRDGGNVLTPEFAAPEQVTGSQVTTATDVYSLGVLLYVLLGGQHPAGSSVRSPADLMKAIVDTDAPKVSDAVTPASFETADALNTNAARRATTPDKLRRLLQGDLDTIVSKALKKSAHERYASVTALADDLRRYLAHQPISARPDALSYRAAKFARRHVRGILTASAIVLTIAGLVTFSAMRLAAERDRARLEAAKAAKVSELITGLLTAADPYRDPDRSEPTVRGVLDAGAVQVQKELADEPELLAEMLTVLGRVYQRLSLYDRAQPLLEQAVAIGRASAAPGHVRVAQSLNDLGVLVRLKGDSARAESLLSESLAMRRRLLGNKDKDVAVTLVELGRAYSSQQHPERAEPLFLEALAIRKEIFGDEHRETATSKSDLALLLWQRGDLVEAERLFRESLGTSRRVLGEIHPNVASSLQNLGLVVADRGDYPAAEALFRQSLDVRRKALGPKSPDLAVTLNNLAYPLREQKKYDEAVAVLEEALALARARPGGESPGVPNYMANLGRVWLAKGDSVKAEAILRETLTIRLRTLSENDWRLAMAKSLLGAALTPLGRYAEAEPLLLDASRVLKDVPGAQGREAKATVVRLHSLYESWGRPDRAAAYVVASAKAAQ